MQHRSATNEQGSPIVIMPLSLWQQLLNDLNTQRHKRTHYGRSETLEV